MSIFVYYGRFLSDMIDFSLYQLNFALYTYIDGLGELKSGDLTSGELATRASKSRRGNDPRAKVLGANDSKPLIRN